MQAKMSHQSERLAQINSITKSWEPFDCQVGKNQTGAKSGKRFDVIDPGSGIAWTSCPDCDANDVDDAVQSSSEAFIAYSAWTPRQRAQCLQKWYQLINDNRDEIAKLLVFETGKPLQEAYGEVDYGNSFVWWFMGEAERIQGTTITSSTPGRRSLTIKQPLGVAAALVPWNFPVALALRKASAALAAGCTMVVKPSPETPASTLIIARLALQAGFPPGALNIVTTSLENTPAVAEALCEHPLVKKVTFTGSTRIGKLISSMCARNLKKCTLELGGNCPFVIFDDADLDHALDQLLKLKWRHAGQACISSNRLYVQRNVYDRFVDAVKHQTADLKIGHGMTDGTTLGPVTTSRSLDKAEELVADATAKGAGVVMGTGQRLGPSELNDLDGGYFMKPTILTHVTDDMLLSKEEIFAPVLGIAIFDTEEEVIKRANDTSMGLASYVFTKDVDRLWRMFEKLEAGMIGLVSDPSLYLKNRSIADHVLEYRQCFFCRGTIWRH